MFNQNIFTSLICTDTNFCIISCGLCPGEWHLQNYSSEPRRLCGTSNIGASGCLSAMYNTYSISYNHVCGRVIRYAYASVDAFGQHAGLQSIEGPYMDGVPLTHGPPGTRQHIWTFAAGFTETVPPAYPDASCPCADHASSRADVPSFVGNDYLCESGNPGTSWTDILYTSDPLWDGQGCGSPPCCELSYPPGVTALVLQNAAPSGIDLSDIDWLHVPTLQCCCSHTLCPCYRRPALLCHWSS